MIKIKLVNLKLIFFTIINILPLILFSQLLKKENLYQKVFAGYIDTLRMPNILNPSQGGITFAINSKNLGSWFVSVINKDNKECIFKGNITYLIKNEELILKFKHGDIYQEQGKKFIAYQMKPNEKNILDSTYQRNESKVEMELKVKNTFDLLNKQILFIAPGFSKEEVNASIAPHKIEPDSIHGQIIYKVKSSFFESVQYVILRYMYGVLPQDAIPFK